MPVPIPVAVWLFGSRLLGLIGIARRKYAGIATARRSPPKAKAIQSRLALRRKTTGSEFTPRFFHTWIPWNDGRNPSSPALIAAALSFLPVVFAYFPARA